MTACIIFFVKYPTPGKVKTRLAENSSPELAARFYAAFVREKLAEFAMEDGPDVLIFFSPDKAEANMAEWLGAGRRYHPQKGDPLGSRMEQAFRDAFVMGYERAVLVGSDIPGLTPDIATEALESLTPDSVAIGPAADGGYYLIGFHKDAFLFEIFDDMQWSTPDVYAKTVECIETCGKELMGMPLLRDMDTLEDLQDHMNQGAFDNDTLATAQALLDAPAP